MTIPDAAKLERYDDLANTVEELHDENMDLRQRCAWVCADKELPDSEETVLLYMPDAYSEPVWPGYFDHYGDMQWFLVDAMPAGRVTHWMHFPEPPPTKNKDRAP